MEERAPHGVRLGDDPASLPSQADGTPVQFKLAHAQLGLMLFRFSGRSMKNVSPHLSLLDSPGSLS
jgi:hypothetical protein